MQGGIRFQYMQIKTVYCKGIPHAHTESEGH